jgi:hypothetical protein
VLFLPLCGTFWLSVFSSERAGDWSRRRAILGMRDLLWMIFVIVG